MTGEPGASKNASQAMKGKKPGTPWANLVQAASKSTPGTSHSPTAMPQGSTTALKTQAMDSFQLFKKQAKEKMDRVSRLL